MVTYSCVELGRQVGTEFNIPIMSTCTKFMFHQYVEIKWEPEPSVNTGIRLNPCKSHRAIKGSRTMKNTSWEMISYRHERGDKLIKYEILMLSRKVSRSYKDLTIQLGWNRETKCITESINFIRCSVDCLGAWLPGKSTSTPTKPTYHWGSNACSVNVCKRTSTMMHVAFQQLKPRSFWSHNILASRISKEDKLPTSTSVCDMKEKMYNILHIP